MSVTTKAQESCYSTHESTILPSSEQLSSALFNIPKTSKANPGASPRYTPNYSNFSYFSNNQSKYSQNKTENSEILSDKNSRARNDFEIGQKSQKTWKEEAEFNYNIGDLQQLLSKHSAKIKHSSDTNQDSVTDSLLGFLQRKSFEKNVQDNFFCETTETSQAVVSVWNKNKSEESGVLKKKENTDDPKLLNELLNKAISEKEEKRIKNLEEKKKILKKEILDDLVAENEGKKTKRDAMSHYQEDKAHHKRAGNYGDFSQWDYLNPQDMQTGNSHNSHNRRGHLPFCGTSQSHSVAWNTMGMGMPHQSNPYYSNPHGHVLPAHAHTEYRYNQWNNPNHKGAGNIQNAHSQNSSGAQSKPEVKHVPQNKSHNTSQEFSVPANPPTEYSKLRTSPHDMVHRTPPPELTHRGSHSDYPPSISPALRNPPPLRTPPPLPGHPKNIVGNPLSGLQMLVANQETEDPPQKMDNYQQESVDLSAHSEATKLKEDNVNKSECEKKEDSKNSSPIVNPVKNSSDDSTEKPVELTAKNLDKNEQSVEGNAEKEISSTNDSAAKENDNCTRGSAGDSDRNNENENEKGKKEEEKEKLEMTEKKVECSNEKETSTAEDSPQGAQQDVKEAEKEIKEEETKTDEDEEIARQLASLDGPESKTDANCTTNKEGSKVTDSRILESTVSKLRSRRKSSNEVPASSSSEEVDESKKSPQKRKASGGDKPEPDSKKVYIEVESELEKMFQGVGELLPEESNDLPTVSSTSADIKPTPSENSKKAPKKRNSRMARSGRLSSGQSSGSENPSHRGKSKSLGARDENRKKPKKNLCDLMESSRKGPVLHVEGTREAPTSVVVVNFPKGDDEDEKDKSVAKKGSMSGGRSISHHNELDYRGESATFVKLD